MRMLTSRTRTSPLNNLPPKPRSCVPVPDASRAVVSLTFPPLASLEGLCLRRRLQDLLRFGVPLEARRGLEVAAHGVGRDEDEARVGLGRPRDPAGDLVQVQLHDGHEARHAGLPVQDLRRGHGAGRDDPRRYSDLQSFLDDFYAYDGDPSLEALSE